jgi:CHAT domain-containing protein/tetratricopeptide (TPR) repeat protein
MAADPLMRCARRAAAALHVVLFVICAAAALGEPPGILVAQQPSPAGPDQVDAWLRSAERLQQAQQHAEATALFERALETAQHHGLQEQQARAMCGLGEIDHSQARYAPARERGSTALQLYEQLAASTPSSARDAIDRGVGRANLLLSAVAGMEGDLAASRQRAERAIAAFEAAGDRRGRANSTLQLLRVMHVGIDAERTLIESVIADARAVSDPALEARALHSFGDDLFIGGRYDEALANLEAAAKLFEAAGQQVRLGTVYTSMGRLYRAHGRLDAALESQLKALALNEKSTDAFAHLQSLNAVAVTYQSLGDLRQSRIYFERALSIAARTSSPRIQDWLRANFSWTLLAAGDDQQAADILEGVIARGLDRYPTLRMRDLAQAQLRLGRKDAAMDWAEKAVDACGNRESLDCVYALDRRAEVSAALGNDEAALTDLRSAMRAVETVRSRLIPADFFKQQFHLAQEDLYSRAIALQLRRGQHAEALETAERARSRAFVDLLASRDLSSAPAAGPTRLANRDLLSDAVVPAASSTQLAATAARLGSTLLAYWVTSDQVFIWAASPDGSVRSSQSRVRLSKLQDLIRSTTPFGENDPRNTPEGRRSALTTRGAASISVQVQGSRAWRELYQLLVKPVRSALPRSRGALLTIVPHGPLGALAFAGLQDERGRYLLEDYAVHYAPSGAALQVTATHTRAGARRGPMLIVADPVPPALSTLDRPLPRLPGARTESRAIAALMPSVPVTRFEGDGARESIVRDAAAGKRVLHFATHAIVRDDDPLSSFLALTRSAAGDDGLLTAQEIYTLRLDADLVVLSACRSGGGRVTGDGIATFARAFIYAGAPSIVASLWDVADEPTNRLIPDFYRSWLRGMSKARALRAAQLRLLNDLRAGKVLIDTPAGRISLPEHPVFWAGFALLGEPD